MQENAIVHSESEAQTPLYDADFYAWTQEQAQLLRLAQSATAEQPRQWDSVDLDNVIEEIESLGRQERNELVNRLGVLLGHLLKWQFQPERRGTSWQAIIREQRRRVKRLLSESPSLQPYLVEAMQEAFDDGVDLAVRETGLPYEKFPADCPYSFEQAIDADFFPDKA